VAVQTRTVEYKPKFAAGLQIPSGASTSKVLVSDGEGNGTWAEVTEARIANEAISTSKLKENAVTEGKLAAASVGTAVLKKEAVSPEKIEKEAVTAEKIAASAVTETKLATSAVTEAKIKSGAVSTEKIATEAVNAEKIKNGTITGEKLAVGAVLAEKIKNEAVTAEKVKPATAPAAPTKENEVTLGTAGVARKFVAAIEGNAVETKFKIKHGLETKFLVSTIVTATFEEPVTMLATVTAISASEVEVVFTVAPGKGTINYVVLVG